MFFRTIPGTQQSSYLRLINKRWSDPIMSLAFLKSVNACCSLSSKSWAWPAGCLWSRPGQPLSPHLSTALSTCDALPVSDH